MKETYRFWSLDSLYKEITSKITQHGVLIKKDSNRQLCLYHGNNYDWGKAHGRNYPAGSMPDRQGNARTPFPATLEIITESVDKLATLEKEWGISDDIPRDSQRRLAPSEKWDARAVPEI